MWILDSSPHSTYNCIEVIKIGNFSSVSLTAELKAKTSYVLANVRPSTTISTNQKTAMKLVLQGQNFRPTGKLTYASKISLIPIIKCLNWFFLIVI